MPARILYSVLCLMRSFLVPLPRWRLVDGTPASPSPARGTWRRRRAPTSLPASPARVWGTGGRCKAVSTSCAGVPWPTCPSSWRSGSTRAPTTPPSCGNRWQPCPLRSSAPRPPRSLWRGASVSTMGPLACCTWWSRTVGGAWRGPSFQACFACEPSAACVGQKAAPPWPSSLTTTRPLSASLRPWGGSVAGPSRGSSQAAASCRAVRHSRWCWAPHRRGHSTAPWPRGSSSWPSSTAHTAKMTPSSWTKCGCSGRRSLPSPVLCQDQCKASLPRCCWGQ